MPSALGRQPKLPPSSLQLFRRNDDAVLHDKARMGCGASRPDASTYKTHLKLLQARLNIKIKKKTELAQQTKRDISEKLRTASNNSSHEAIARIKVESVIRDDYLIEAYEYVHAECWSLLQNLSVLELGASAPPVEVAQAVCTLILAAYLWSSEMTELTVINDLFVKSYGAAFIDDVRTHRTKYQRDRILRIINASSSSAEIEPAVVDAYLKEIAAHYEIDYTPSGPRGQQAPEASPTVALPVATPLPWTPVVPMAIPVDTFVTGFDPNAVDAELASKAEQLAGALDEPPGMPLGHLVAIAARRLDVTVTDLGSATGETNPWHARVIDAHRRLCENQHV